MGIKVFQGWRLNGQIFDSGKLEQFIENSKFVLGLNGQNPVAIALVSNAQNS